MTKVKVSREVAEAIEFQLERKRGDIDDLIARHAGHKNGFGKFYARSAILDEMSVSQFASALINGYEVEETPEEKWSRRYKQTVDCLAFLIADDVRDLLEKEKWVIEEMAKDFGLKIEGVNA